MQDADGEGDERQPSRPRLLSRTRAAGSLLLILAAAAATFLVAAHLAGPGRTASAAPSSSASIEAVSAPEATLTLDPTLTPASPPAVSGRPTATHRPSTAPEPSGAVPATTAKPARTPSPGPARASITSPADGAEVPEKITVRGDLGGNLAGHSVWLFVQALSDAGRQFVTAPIPVTGPGPAHPFTTTPTFVGDDASSGLWFVIEVVAADPAATRVIEDEPIGAGNAKSFATLPDGSAVIGRTTVRRS